MKDPLFTIAFSDYLEVTACLFRMADWSILKSSSNDFLSSLTTYSNHDPTLTQLHMMSSFIDRTFSSQNIYDENTFCKPDNVEECLTHLNQVKQNCKT